MFLIVYIINVIVTFILGFMYVTYSGSCFNWRDITIGELLFIFVTSVIPIINSAIAIIYFIYLIEDGMLRDFFDIQPFKRRKNE
jgi:hypothetical protein